MLPPVPLKSPSGTDTATHIQQNNNQFYCGYCDFQCKTPTDLVAHCEQNSHKYAVFADSGRDVFWEFEPPPPDLKNNKISQADG